MSENQKKIFALIAAATLTLIIVVVWFSFSENSNKVAEKEENKLSSLSPIQVIKEEFSKAFSGFNASVVDIGSTSTESTSTLITDGQARQIEIIEE